MLIDTHQVVEDIIKAGLNKEQAEVITRAINQSNNNLVTKADLRDSTEKLNSKIEILNSKINEVNTEIKSIKSEINTTKWMLGLLGALNLMILSIILSGKF